MRNGAHLPACVRDDPAEYGSAKIERNRSCRRPAAVTRERGSTGGARDNHDRRSRWRFATDRIVKLQCEMVRISPHVCAMILPSMGLQKLSETALAEGLRPLRVSAAAQVARGITTIAEVVGVLPPVE